MEDQKLECCEESPHSMCEGSILARYKERWYKSGSAYCAKHWVETEYMLEDAH